MKNIKLFEEFENTNLKDNEIVLWLDDATYPITLKELFDENSEEYEYWSPCFDIKADNDDPFYDDPETSYSAYDEIKNLPFDIETTIVCYINNTDIDIIKRTIYSIEYKEYIKQEKKDKFNL